MGLGRVKTPLSFRRYLATTAALGGGATVCFGE
jgi:hypothetical protein